MDRETLSQQPPLLTCAELAERWCCSPGWLANMRCAGQGPPFLKLGSNVRYRLQDVVAYEDSSRSAV